MLARASHQGRADAVGLPGPLVRARPAALGHHGVQGLADGRGRPDRVRPLEVRVGIRPHRDQDEPGPQLRDAELAGVQHLPVRLVAKVVQLTEDLLAVAGEPRLGEPRDVLQHHCGRLTLPDKAQRLREQVTLVVSAELLARHRERRARNAAGKEVNTVVGAAIELVNVPFDDLPHMLPVQAQCLASIRVNLDSRGMGESCVLQSQGLTAGSGADFQTGQLMHGISQGGQARSWAAHGSGIHAAIPRSGKKPA